MPLPDIDGFTGEPQRYVAEQLQREAEDLLRRAASFGLVLTIEQVNGQPPRMGNYRTQAVIRPDIWSVRKAYEKAAGAPAPVLTESPEYAGYSRPLAAATMERIERGVEKFCSKANAA